jgi:hypothetical protein
VNDAQQAFIDAMTADHDRVLAASREAVSGMRQLRDAYVNEREHAAYAKIEKLAAARVEKSANPVTLEQAVADVLKTKEGAALYAVYTAATTQRRDVLAKSADSSAARGLESWAAEKVDKVYRAARNAGLDEEAARADVAERVDPAVLRLAGSET